MAWWVRGAQMSAFLGRIPTFYRGYRFSGVASTPESAFLQTLSQRPGWRMAVVAEIANVIDGLALAFLDHQHFIFPALGALFQIDAQRNIARIAVRDGGGAGDHGAVCRGAAAGERISLQ